MHPDSSDREGLRTASDSEPNGAPSHAIKGPVERALVSRAGLGGLLVVLAVVLGFGIGSRIGSAKGPSAGTAGDTSTRATAGAVLSAASPVREARLGAHTNRPSSLGGLASPQANTPDTTASIRRVAPARHPQPSLGRVRVHCPPSRSAASSPPTGSRTTPTPSAACSPSSGG